MKIRRRCSEQASVVETSAGTPSGGRKPLNRRAIARRLAMSVNGISVELTAASGYRSNMDVLFHKEYADSYQQTSGPRKTTNNT